MIKRVEKVVPVCGIPGSNFQSIYSFSKRYSSELVGATRDGFCLFDPGDRRFPLCRVLQKRTDGNFAKYDSMIFSPLCCYLACSSLLIALMK